MQTDDSYVRQGLKRVDGWLFPYSVDFIRSIAGLQRDTGIAGSVGEIGVHHGKLFILLALARQAGEGAFAIDVFGDQHLNRDESGRGDRDIFLGNVARWLGGPETVTVLQRSSLEVRPEDILAATGPVRLASVDGGHTEDCVVNDLHLMQAVLAPAGVVILDDYFNEFWPEVASGVARYCSDPAARLRPFAISPNKTYFAAADGAADFYRSALRHKNGYYYEKTAHIFGHAVDIYGTQPWTFSLKRRLMENLRQSRFGPLARRVRAQLRRA